MRIAVIQDKHEGPSELTRVLIAGGATCHGFEDADAFLYSLPRDSFDACVFDMESNRSGMNAADLLQALHEHKRSMPALVLTAAGSELDVIEIIDSHTDDFLVKPLRPGELRARLMAMLRRATPGNGSDEYFAHDRFELDLKTLRVKVSGKEVELTQKEFQLALLFLSNIGKPLSRAHIRETVWGRNSEVPSRTLDTHVSRVRTKLSLRPESGYLLAPVYSFGYRLEDLNRAEDRTDIATRFEAVTEGNKVAANGQ